MLDVLDAKIKAQGLKNVRTRRVDLEQGDELTGTFDLAVSSMTFHHIRDTGMLLDRISRCPQTRRKDCRRRPRFR